VGGHGHTSTSLSHQSATWNHAVNMHCLYTSAFSTSCYILSVMNGKWTMYLHQVLPEVRQIHYWYPCNALWGFSWMFSKPDSSFWIAFMFQGRSSISWKWQKFTETKHQQNEKMLGKFENSFMKTIADTIGISYEVCQEILTENLRVCHIAPSLQQHCRPHVPENHIVRD
jgi:hypothetical protein